MAGSSPMRVRVQKLMAEAGLGSRRHNEELIRAGRVSINGRRAALGDRADPSTDVVEVDGRKLSTIARVYVKIYKPRGIISSTEDELGKGRPTVRELVPLPGHLFVVGRLDKQSEGLMLLTNDGELAHRLTHPRFGHEKSYRVALEGQVPAASLEQWRRGLELDDRTTAPVHIEVLNRQQDHTLLQITMHEGRKHQIRRIAAQLGHPVTKLLRERIGPVELGHLKPGDWRHLTGDERSRLLKSVQSGAGARSQAKPGGHRRGSVPRR
jgi:23S rRNA pseudouridine2605 synthase